MNWPGPLQARWQAASRRDRRGLLMAAVVLGLAWVWWLGVAPALVVLRLADAQHQALEVQWQQMQRLQTQAQALQALPTLDAQETRRALEASVKALGSAAQITPQMDRMVVALKGVDALALTQWLNVTRQNAHVMPTEVHLKRAGAANWEGSVVFTLPAQ